MLRLPHRERFVAIIADAADKAIDTVWSLRRVVSMD
jgi:hypothetical protein